MSDEIKVNSELPQKLATLGQVKDALDKRDEKINSLKEDRDYFDRQNGVLQTAPTGQVYHLINNRIYNK